ncbi:hypothetical protein HZH68_005537 [Vespula germanica]|uniref:Uncharacterized protein n=1 Tax=Vespula germanica TaxID=30212 RepID=A0A834KGA7_VESGE|nr:hypothetical protein HZH68_005537 [Vespula germanica]
MRGSREEGRVSLEEEKNNAQSHMEECGPSGPESPSSVPHRIGEAKREESIHARTSGLYEGNVVVLVEMERVKGGEEKRAEKQSHDGRVRRGAEDEVREESYDAAQLAVRGMYPYGKQLLTTADRDMKV